MPRTAVPPPQPSPAETGAGTERHSLEHPPGYAQNAGFHDAATGLPHPGGVDDEDGVVGQAKRWAESAGEGLKNLEESAWRWVRGSK